MRTHEHGFSLVELMVAMTITLIVSAAIYGLLTSGSNAFRREPELSDRQQNIRVAMDLVARDVFNAGAGLPTFSQVFSISDPTGGACTGSLNGCGVMGTLGAAAAAARAPGDGSDPLENTDVLEMVAVDEQCPVHRVCSTTPAPGSAGLFVTREGVSRCMRLPGFALLTDNTSFAVQPADAVTGAVTPCSGGSATQNGNLTLRVLEAGFRTPGPSLLTATDIFLYPGRVARYQIAPGNDPADPTLPALWRSETGRYTATGAVGPEPGAGGTDSPWQLVARGIEDLQIEYMAGDLLWRNQPPLSTPTQWNSIVRQVRITLSARASAANLAGETTAGGGAPPAVRGQLSTTVTPRAAFNELQMGNQIR